MALSTMQEILILLEDENQLPLYRINRWGRPARGVLSKLKNLDYVAKIKIGDEDWYKITQKGEQYFDNTLAPLKENIKWDQKWRLVMFDIPESKRSSRDKLRRALSALGMGILQASVWISPSDIKEDVEAIGHKLKLEKSIKFFEVSSTASLNQQIIDKAWNLPEINLSLEHFIKDAERSLKNMGKGNGDRYNSKKLIFEYALILKKDPKLPLEFVEKDELRKRARDTYLKLRKRATA